MWIRLTKIEEDSSCVKYQYTVSYDEGSVTLEKVTGNIVCYPEIEDPYRKYFQNIAKAFVLRCWKENDYPDSKYYAYG